MQKFMTGLAMTLALLALAATGIGWVDVSSLRQEIGRAPENPRLVPYILTAGLGERMNSLARRFAGLWFAARSGNRDLALYELEEMNEVIAGIRVLKPVENGVNVGDVLEAISNTELERMKEAVQSNDVPRFESYYRATIASCNSCHMSARHGFILIKIPDRPPLSNRIYEATKDD